MHSLFLKYKICYIALICRNNSCIFLRFSLLNLNQAPNAGFKYINNVKIYFVFNLSVS